MRLAPLTWATAAATGAFVLLSLPQPGPPTTAAASRQESPRLADLKAEVVVDVDSRRDFTQQMVDMLFSFGELGFQEFRAIMERSPLLGGRSMVGHAALDRGIGVRIPASQPLPAPVGSPAVRARSRRCGGARQPQSRRSDPTVQSTARWPERVSRRCLRVTGG